MVKHSDWRNSPAKAWIKQKLEEGILNPEDLDAGELYESHKELFGEFNKRRFKDNVRNLVNSFLAKKPPLPKKQATARVRATMNRPSEGKSNVCYINYKKYEF